MEGRALSQAIGDFGCRFHTVGIGAKHLPSSDQLTGISCIILCGLAGALDPSLSVGDVVLDDANRFAVPLRRGRIHTASQIISTPQEKAECFVSTGALVVDMEQAIVREFADHYQIPLVGLRTVSDTAAETLNPKVIRFVDDLGRPKPASIALGLIGQPRLIPYLRRLNANTKYALLQLTDALEAILTSIVQGNLR